MRVRDSLSSLSSARIQLLALQYRAWLTPSEARLWSALKRRQLGVTFRRQVVLADRFIVDFFAPSVRLVVEVDGADHARHRAHADQQRDLKLRRAGLRIVRVCTELVLSDLAAAVALVRAAL